MNSGASNGEPIQTSQEEGRCWGMPMSRFSCVLRDSGAATFFGTQIFKLLPCQDLRRSASNNEDFAVLAWLQANPAGLPSGSFGFLLQQAALSIQANPAGRAGGIVCETKGLSAVRHPTGEGEPGHEYQEWAAGKIFCRNGPLTQHKRFPSGYNPGKGIPAR